MSNVHQARHAEQFYSRNHQSDKKGKKVCVKFKVKNYNEKYIILSSLCENKR